MVMMTRRELSMEREKGKGKGKISRLDNGNGKDLQLPPTLVCSPGLAAGLPARDPLGERPSGGLIVKRSRLARLS